MKLFSQLNIFKLTFTAVVLSNDTVEINLSVILLSKLQGPIKIFGIYLPHGSAVSSKIY